jgi:hypothetical protein
MLFTLFGINLLVSCSGAAELFVAQKDPAATDKNLGTEAAPFKTIQAAVDKVQAGDTIWVKAGLYQEPVYINKSGHHGRLITLSAWKDDRVRIGFPPEPLPMEGKWEPIPGGKPNGAPSRSFQVKLAKDLPDDVVVILNEKPLLTRVKDTPPPDGKPLWVTYRKADRTLMFNANGKDPSSLGKLEYSRLGGYMFLMDRVEWWVVRRLEFQWLDCGLGLHTHNSAVEECFFDHTYHDGIHILGGENAVRRCTFHRCGCAVGADGCGPANVIQENLIVECGMSAEDDIRNDGAGGEFGGGPTCFKAANVGLVFAYNIVADCLGGAGWYADINARSCRVIGNAFWNNSGGGIYNEEAVHDTLVIGNYFYHDALTSACCARLNIADNFFNECGVGWFCLGEWPLLNSYMVLRGNAFYNPPAGYLTGLSRGKARSLYPEHFRGSLVDYNRIWLAPEALLINDGGTKYSSLNKIRQEFHWEHHGEVLPLAHQTAEQAVAAMGGSVATFRVPWSKRTGEARPMLSAADTEFRWPAVVDADAMPSLPQFFWHVAEGNDDTSPLCDVDSYCSTGSYCWQPSSQAGYGMGEKAGCRWYSFAELKFPDVAGSNIKMELPATDDGPKSLAGGGWTNCPVYSCGNHWLVMEGVTPEKMLPQGVGYWSPRLAAAPGAKTTISLKMRCRKLISSDKGSPSVWLEFTNGTGQDRQRAFIVGMDDQGKMHHEELTKGDYDWTEVKETIPAPQGAVRMALFFGLRPCKGKVDFDDINIRTASEGPGVTEAAIPAGSSSRSACGDGF